MSNDNCRPRRKVKYLATIPTGFQSILANVLPGQLLVLVVVVNPVILDRPEPDHRFHLCHMPHVL